MANTQAMKNAAVLAVIQTKLDALSEDLKSLDQKLFGNGQPGEIASIKKRVAKVETWMWRTTGAIGLAVLIIEVAIWALHKVR